MRQLGPEVEQHAISDHVSNTAAQSINIKGIRSSSNSRRERKSFNYLPLKQFFKVN